MDRMEVFHIYNRPSVLQLPCVSLVSSLSRSLSRKVEAAAYITSGAQFMTIIMSLEGPHHPLAQPAQIQSPGRH